MAKMRSDSRSQRTLSTRVPVQQPISMTQQRSSQSLVPGAWNDSYFQRQDGFRHAGEMDYPSLREQRRRSYDPTMFRRHQMDLLSHHQPQAAYPYTAQSMSQDPHYMREQHAHHSSTGMLLPDSRGFDESGSQNSPGTHLFSEEEYEQGVKAGNLGMHCSQPQFNSQIEMSQEFEDAFQHSEFLSPKTLTGEDYYQQKLYAMSQEMESQHENLTPSNHQPHPARGGGHMQQCSPPQAAKLTKSRVYHRSLNDISVSNSPIAEATSLHTLQEEPRTSQTGLRVPTVNQRKTFHRSQGAINSMGNEHSPEVSYPPGLQSSLAAALSRPHQYHSQNVYHSSRMQQNQRSRLQQHQKQTMSHTTAPAASQGNSQSRHNLHQIQRQKQEPQLQPNQEPKQQKQQVRTEEVQQEQSVLRGSGRRFDYS